jgi:hypothetical protein
VICTAIALIYSGRRDPQWQVTPDVTRALRTLWLQMSDASGAIVDIPGLGYRGCTLNCGSDAQWHAFGGVVVMGNAHKHDKDRAFERYLLESAPAGLIPESILKSLP